MALAETVRKRRTDHGMSRAELARRAGVDTNYLWRIWLTLVPCRSTTKPWLAEVEHLATCGR